MSGAQARDTAVPSVGWMLLHSTWMLATVIPGAALGWLAFLIIGVVGRLPRWIVTGVALGAAALLAALPVWGQWQPLVRAIVYLGGMLLALMANPSWLRARWAKGHPAGSEAAPVMVRSASAQAPTRGSAPARSRSGSRTRAASDDRGRTPEQGEAEQLAERAGASTATYFAAPTQQASAPPAATEPIDVNAADAGALAELPGISRSKARSLVSQREKQGGFASLDAFATSAGLQPHQLVQLRQAAVCSPPPRGRRQFGRRVDY